MTRVYPDPFQALPWCTHPRMTAGTLAGKHEGLLLGPCHQPLSRVSQSSGVCHHVQPCILRPSPHIVVIETASRPISMKSRREYRVAMSPEFTCCVPLRNASCRQARCKFGPCEQCPSARSLWVHLQGKEASAPGVASGRGTAISIHQNQQDGQKMDQPWRRPLYCPPQGLLARQTSRRVSSDGRDGRQ